MNPFRRSTQDDRDATEFLDSIRPADYDARTYKFGEAGASGTGLPEPVTEPITRYRPAPDMFPALPAAPQRRPDCAIFTILPGGGFGLLCGIDRWRRHADPGTIHARHCFDALRASALAAGWRPDAYGRWACPRCKKDPAYVTPQPVAHWHPDGHDGRGRMMTGHGGYRDGQFWLQVEAENEVFRRTRSGEPAGWADLNAARAAKARERHGRHAAGAR
jgi:hypothetical protein